MIIGDIISENYSLLVRNPSTLLVAEVRVNEVKFKRNNVEYQLDATR